MNTQQFTRPDRTKLFGVTHSLDGSPIRRQTRSLKIGIGVPSGKDLHVWMRPNGDWAIEVGVYSDGKRTGGDKKTFKTRSEAEAAYASMYAEAPDRKYPSKLSFFTFLRPNKDGTGFVHDFDAIEAHGPMPTSVPIFFTTDQPLATGMEWWSASKLNCWGDGLNALRRIELAVTPEEKELAKNPIDEKYFPIIGGCSEGGCGYCQDSTGPTGKVIPRVCKPHSKIVLQLANSPSIGSTTTFDTTGFRSTQQLGSSLTDILEATGQGDPDKGRVAGIPLELVLRPYVAHPGGRKTTLHAVNVEFHPKTTDDAKQITQAMIRYANSYRAVPMLAEAAKAQLSLEAPTKGWTDAEEAEEAELLESEFPVSGGDQHEGSAEAAATKAQEKVAALRARGATVTIPKATKVVPIDPKVEPVQESFTEQESQFEATDDDLPEVMQTSSEPTEPAWRTDLRALELKMKAAKKGGLFRDLLEKYKSENIEGIDEATASALICDIEDALAQPEPTKPTNGKLKLL